MVMELTVLLEPTRPCGYRGDGVNETLPWWWS